MANQDVHQWAMNLQIMPEEKQTETSPPLPPPSYVSFKASGFMKTSSFANGVTMEREN